MQNMSNNHNDQHAKIDSKSLPVLPESHTNENLNEDQICHMDDATVKCSNIDENQQTFKNLLQEYLNPNIDLATSSDGVRGEIDSLSGLCQLVKSNPTLRLQTVEGDDIFDDQIQRLVEFVKANPAFDWNALVTSHQEENQQTFNNLLQEFLGVDCNWTPYLCKFRFRLGRLNPEIDLTTLFDEVRNKIGILSGLFQLVMSNPTLRLQTVEGDDIFYGQIQRLVEFVRANPAFDWNALVTSHQKQTFDNLLQEFLQADNNWTLYLCKFCFQLGKMNPEIDLATSFDGVQDEIDMLSKLFQLVMSNPTLRLQAAEGEDIFDHRLLELVEFVRENLEFDWKAHLPQKTGTEGHTGCLRERASLEVGIEVLCDERTGDGVSSLAHSGSTCTGQNDGLTGTSSTSTSLKGEKYVGSEVRTDDGVSSLAHSDSTGQNDGLTGTSSTSTSQKGEKDVGSEV